MMKKQQQWLFKVFSMINSSSSSITTTTTSFNNVRLRRPFCSAAAAAITNTSSLLFAAPATNTVAQPPVSSSSNKQQQQEKLFNILLEKKLPLLIVPHDNVTPQKYVQRGRKSEDRSICDGTLGFISLFHHDDEEDQLIINNKKKMIKKQEEVEVYKVYLPEIAKRRICGSSEGWLFTIHRNGEIQLINPVTRVIVHLPPLTAFPGVASEFVSECEDTKGRLHYLFFDFPAEEEPPYYRMADSHYFREIFIEKAVTNTTTTGTNSATGVVVLTSYYYLAFCRTSSSTTGNGIDDDEPAAAKRWINIRENDCGTCWTDVTFYKGNFYAVGCFGEVGVVKGLDGPSPFTQLIIDVPEAEPEYYSHYNYLVESPSSSSSSSGGGGDLLMVMRDVHNIDEYSYSSSSEEEKEEETEVETEREEETEVETEKEEEENYEHPYRTTGFKVWKLDLNGPSWEEVTDLGEDCALFVGYNHSFSFSASKFPGCRGNCIYFTDSHPVKTFIYPTTGGHDIGVYNLEDASFEKLYETSSSQLFMPPPVWYVPAN